MPGVDAVHIGGGVCFSIAQLLRLFQRFVIAKTQAGHVVEDIVAGAVHDATYLIDCLDAAGALQLGKPADAAAHRCGAAQGYALLDSQGNQLVIEGADHGLVGGDDVFPGFQCGAGKVIAGMQAAHGFHNGVDFRVIQDFREVFYRLGIGELNVL